MRATSVFPCQLHAALLSGSHTSFTQVSYSSVHSLGSWFNDLLMRVEFFKKWIRGGPPKSYWISAFFLPARIAATVLQSHARLKDVSADTLSIRYLSVLSGRGRPWVLVWGLRCGHGSGECRTGVPVALCQAVIALSICVSRPMKQETCSHSGPHPRPKAWRAEEMYTGEAHVRRETSGEAQRRGYGRGRDEERHRPAQWSAIPLLRCFVIPCM